jgi:hypothetical protein
MVPGSIPHSPEEISLMRRLLAAAVFAALFATAACGSGDDAAGDGGTTAGPATTAAAAANTEQICADAKKVVTDSTAKFTQELGKILTSAASGDPSANSDSVNTIKTMFTEWAQGLRDQADKATDGQLKSALSETADQIAKVATSIKSATDLEQADKLLDSPELEAASKKIESICG